MGFGQLRKLYSLCWKIFCERSAINGRSAYHLWSSLSKKWLILQQKRDVGEARIGLASCFRDPIAIPIARVSPPWVLSQLQKFEKTFVIDFLHSIEIQKALPSYDPSVFQACIIQQEFSWKYIRSKAISDGLDLAKLLLKMKLTFFNPI